MGGDRSGEADTVPSVRLSDGDDASGMAVMLADLLADNLRDYPARSRVAHLVRGSVVMTAADRDRSVTVTFAGREVSIADGSLDGAPRMVGEWLDLAQLCSGRLSPIKAVTGRRLTVHNIGRVDLLAAAGYVMSVPASYYGEATRWTLERIVLTLALVAFVVALILGIRRPCRAS